MDMYLSIISGTLAVLPLLVALYMWRSGDAKEEKGIFWGCIALAVFAIAAPLYPTTAAYIAAAFFGCCVLYAIASVVRSAARATK